jgi:hypothetical protein
MTLPTRWRPILAINEPFPRGNATRAGFNAMARHGMTPSMAHTLGLGELGCPWRGSVECRLCPLADFVARECDYCCVARVGVRMQKCPDFETCACGALTSGVTPEQLLLIQAVAHLYALADAGRLPDGDCHQALARLRRWLRPGGAGLRRGSHPLPDWLREAVQLALGLEGGE